MFSSKSYTLRLRKTAGYFPLLLGLLAMAFSTQKSFAATNTFNFTGGAQTFTNPPTVTSITVTLTGGRGAKGGNDSGNSGGSGGQAGRVTGTITNLTPGEILTIYAGAGGADGSSNVSNTGGGSGGSSAGAPLGGGGGRGGNAGGKTTWFFGTVLYPSGGGGGGGGAAWLYRSTNTALTNLVAVAGGGGGGGGAGGANAGLGGSIGLYWSGTTTGQNGTDRGSSNDGGGGGGGGGGYPNGGAGGGLRSSGDTDSGGTGGSNGANYTNGLASPTSTAVNWDGTAQVQIVFNGLPTAPTISGTSDLSRVTLSWTAPASALTITDYIVQYKPEYNDIVNHKRVK